MAAALVQVGRQREASSAVEQGLRLLRVEAERIGIGDAFAPADHPRRFDPQQQRFLDRPAVHAGGEGMHEGTTCVTCKGAGEC